MPDNLRGRRYYHPTTEGREKLLAQRLEEIQRARDAARKSSKGGDNEPAS
jgi:putative ATPase